MGRLSEAVEPEIQHFSHPHPLKLGSILHGHENQTQCSGCKHPIASGWTYTCTPCNFTLHRSCSQTPHQITHPFDTHHTMHLLPTPIYPEGLFNCDACGKPGNGFSYRCTPCGIDLHLTCASMPLSLIHSAHPHHPLCLAFSPPYHNKVFSCDLCGNPGASHWLYRCDFCGFDAHLECVIRTMATATTTTTTTTTALGAPPMRVASDAHRNLRPVGYVPSNLGTNANFGNIRQQQQGSILDQICQGLVGGIVGGGGGRGGDGGGDNGASQILVQGLLGLSGLGGLGGLGGGGGSSFESSE